MLKHTTGPARLVLIDDASPDPAIAPLLARYASRAGIAVLRNERNRGFTATANRGIAEAGRADHLSLWAGQGVAAIRPMPAAALVAALEAEWRAALAGQAALQAAA